MNADVDIETASYHNVITVPSQAVLGRSIDSLPMNLRNSPEVDQSKTTALVVYRLVNGKAVVTPVTVGASDVTRTVIKSGLKEGDPVITGPFKILDSLTDGQMAANESPTTAPTSKPSTNPATNPTTNSTTNPTTGPTTKPTTRSE